MSKQRLLIAGMGLVLALGAVSTASAETSWERHHPRRDEVNDRLAHQNHRIREERREGDLTARLAHRLHRADWRIRHQERRYAWHHHGHISRWEQHRLNHEENRVGHHIPG
jgi:hypothetical protein